jgi:hypothetical protein
VSSLEPPAPALKRLGNLLLWLPLYAAGAVMVIPVIFFWLFFWFVVYAYVIIKALRGRPMRMFDQ